MNKSFRAAKSGDVRTEKFEGRDHLVFPIVALVEGVIFALTADNPELVLAEEFSRQTFSWNGRHLVLDHPKVNGEATGANNPSILEQYDIGSVFNAHVEGKKLLMEAWLDLERVAKLGASDIVDRITSGTIEVSVGVIADVENASGEYDGKKYSGIWRNIVPDHMALLPEGMLGACSIEMGCGAPRSASKKEDALTLKEKFLALVESFKSRQAAAPEDGTGDNELRGQLDSLLFAEEPGYLGIEVVYPESSSVVYAIAPNGELIYAKRSYEKAADGSITLGKSEVVTPVTKFETASASPCGCGKSASHQSIPHSEEVSMDKKTRVAAIIASGKTCFTTADAAVLEQLPDERIKALEDHVAAPVPPVVAPKAEEKKELTPEEERAEFLAKHPDIAEIVTEHKAASAAKRLALTTSIKAASKSFTDEDLAALSIDQLAKIATLSAKPVDFAVGATPAAPKSDAPASSDELRAASRARMGLIKK